MTVLRTLMLVLLTALLLPWSAYFATATAVRHAQISLEAASDHAMPAKRNCRTGLLPGAPCGPDVVEATGKAAETAPRLERIRFASVGRVAARRTIRPPTGLPRST